jgi:hypothetical protein
MPIAAPPILVSAIYKMASVQMKALCANERAEVAALRDRVLARLIL